MRMTTAPATTPSWTVYRLETASSVYLLGMSADGGRRRVVLRSVTTRSALTQLPRPPTPTSIPATPVALAASGIRPAPRYRDDEPDPQQRDTLPTIRKREIAPEMQAAMEAEAMHEFTPESSQEIRRDRRERLERLDPITDVPPAPYPESMVLLMESAA